MQLSRLQLPAMLVVVAGVYFAAAQFGLSMASVHANVSPVWPPTGIAISAVMLLGYRIWPAITAGALLANLATGVSVATAGGIATGNTLEAIAAVYLIRRFIGFRSPFESVANVVKFVLFASVLGTAVSATIGNLSLCLNSYSSWNDFSRLWLTWWLGDGVGALVVAPLILTWAEKSSQRWTAAHIAEASLVMFLLAVISVITFSGLFFQDLEHLTIPLVVWAAFRLRQRGAAAAIALLSVIATYGTTRGAGPSRSPRSAAAGPSS